MIKQEKRNNRFLWIDVAKGMGVFLVVLGHLWYACDIPEIGQAIYSFHVSVFFVLSGFLIKRKRNEDFCKFAKNKFFRLIVPTFFYILLTLPIYFKYQNPHSTEKVLRAIFFVDGALPFNYACWFFIVMFEVLLLERALRVKEQPIYIKIILATMFLLIGFLLYENKIAVPYGLEKAFITFPFLVGGAIAREIVDKLRNRKWNKWWIILSIMLVSGAIWYMFGLKLNPKTSFYQMKLQNYWYFICSGGFGSLMFCCFSALVTPVLAFMRIIGQNSFFLVATHYIPVFYFRRYAKIWRINKTTKCTLIAVALAFAIVLVSVPINMLIKRYIPFLIGEKRNKKLSQN